MRLPSNSRVEAFVGLFGDGSHVALLMLTLLGELIVSDLFHEEAIKRLPCNESQNCAVLKSGQEFHGYDCPAWQRPALAAKLREESQQQAKSKVIEAQRPH